MSYPMTMSITKSNHVLLIHVMLKIDRLPQNSATASSWLKKVLSMDCILQQHGFNNLNEW